MKTIKTWQERLDTDKWPNVAMQAEIDELRAALEANTCGPGAGRLYTEAKILCEYGDARAARARQQALEEAAQSVERSSLTKIEDTYMQVFIGQLMAGTAAHLRSMK